MATNNFSDLGKILKAMGADLRWAQVAQSGLSGFSKLDSSHNAEGIAFNVSELRSARDQLVEHVEIFSSAVDHLAKLHEEQTANGQKEDGKWHESHTA